MIAHVINKGRRRADRAIDWLVLPIGALIILAAAFWPASWWYELDSVVVLGKWGDDDRLISVDRTIRRDFAGKWRVEEQRQLSGGKYVTVQICHGEHQYRTDKDPPEPPTLDWWKGRNCGFVAPFEGLAPGTYRICTWIWIEPRWSSTKTINNCSPPFSRQ